MKTAMTELLKIEHPIMQGGMQYMASPELAAAVSEAGGIGTINAAAYHDDDSFRNAILEVKKRTEKPFCVNISLIPEVSNEAYNSQIRIMAQEKVPVIETAGANPKEYVEAFKKGGFIWIHKAPTVKHALKGQELGADAVSVVGYEAGGHPGKDELGSLVLLRAAARALSIPVLGAGGFADGAGLVAALALGASGIVMGTRFVTATECACHDNFKKWVVNSHEGDTVTVQRSIHNIMRTASNGAAKTCLEMEAKGAGLKELMPVISGKKCLEGYNSGNTDTGLFPIGEAVGLIDDIRPAGDIIDAIMREADDVISNLGRL